MSETTALIRQALEAEGAAGKYMGLYCLSIFILWVLYQHRNPEKEMISTKDGAVLCYGLTALISICFWPVVWLLCMKTAVISDYMDMLLLLPLLPMIAYAAVQLCEAQHTVQRKWMCIGSCVLLIALSTTVLPYQSPALKAKYADRNVKAVIEAVIAQKAELDEPVVLLGQQEIMESARRYDGEIELLYGKDMWMPTANTAVADLYPQDYVYLYERMKTDYQYPEEMAQLAERFGCNVLVLREKLSPHTAEYDRWQLAAQIPGYVVYRISK